MPLTEILLELLVFIESICVKKQFKSVNAPLVGADIIRPKETDGSNQHFHGLHDIA
ncbi:MAG: hypothetical protein IJI53_03765 [Clostridia bacterium]|nr:hypothetical protein [Clostridia bacterium]MBR0407137.1 hypothetical protein [Clostridia bacterium]